ncbi:hypothetical protein [Alcaligenes sp. 13f]|uniref:hypothetical protein n=1 Tax=Alcaligenes sp. 13f TaxID=2841924 RepID=UPI00299EDBF8|nr:hypothetical protein [Alcaligenes sp. 13f]
MGSLIPEAYRVVRPIERVLVWDRDVTAAQRLIESLSQQGFEARLASDLDSAVGEVDIVSCATLGSGSHLDLIGSFNPQMREADDACFSHALLYIDTQEALQKSGELLGPMSRGVLSLS